MNGAELLSEIKRDNYQIMINNFSYLEALITNVSINSTKWHKINIRIINYQ